MHLADLGQFIRKRFCSMLTISRYRKHLVVPMLLLIVVGLAISGTARLATHAAGITSKPSSCGAWNVLTSANTSPTATNVLNSIAATATSNIWAVGYYTDPGTNLNQALTEQWNGTAWNVVPAAQLTVANALTGVVAIPNTSKLWAVGYTTDPNTGISQTLIEQWNGTTWNVIPSVNVGTASNFLTGVTVVNRKDAWAAGYYVDSSGNNQSLIERWDGTSWSVVPSPNPGLNSNVLTAINAHAANKIWVVGYYTNSSTGYEHTLTERWLGKNWQVISSPNGSAGNSVLNAVIRVPNLDQMWAVGSDYRSGSQHTLIEHWDGRTWAVVTSANPTGTTVSLTGLAALSLTSIWAVGFYTDPTSGLSLTLTEHWDGTAWSIVSSPNPGSGNNSFNGAARVPGSNHIEAAGSDNTTGSPSQTLVEQYC